MTNKSPYAFPLRSRAAMVEFLTRRGKWHHYQRYAFAWDVKTHFANFDGDSLRAHVPDLESALDSAWDTQCGYDSNAFYRWCEDAGRTISEGEWCSYPGDDQGDWEFSFAGRSGGWIVLEKWRGRDVRDLYPEELMDAEEWPFADLRAFYRGIVCADFDFTPVKAAREVEFFAADDRAQWEKHIRDVRDMIAADMAAAIEAARPDMYEGIASWRMDKES